MKKSNLKFIPQHDQTIVLKGGEIVEIGNHNHLVSHKKYYFNLVKNQLELGN